jgi:hypothetical protein
VFFRADSMSTAFSMLGRLVTGWSTPTTLVHPMVLFAIAGMLALQLIPRTPASVLKQRIAELKPVAMGVAFGLVLVVIASLGPQGVAPFIYFRF